jgi:hypothetical protein
MLRIRIGPVKSKPISPLFFRREFLWILQLQLSGERFDKILCLGQAALG